MNTQLRLATRPRGLPQPSDFSLATSDDPVPADGEVLVKVTHLSLDPAMRGWLNDARSYVPPVGIGEVMRAQAVGTVVASRADLPEGTRVMGMLGAQTLAVAKAGALLPLAPGGPGPELYLGVLGSTGLTAYFGLFSVGELKPGETLVVSAAAGAVGSVAVQLGRIVGCRVVAIAGGEQKCQWVRELGADVAIDYKSQDVRRAVREAAPRGVDVYFDNVGGPILDAVLANLARHARVVICGAISQYNATEPPRGPANYLSLLVSRARMEGFLVFDFEPRYPQARAALARWLEEGRLRSRETIIDGELSAFVPTLNRLFSGDNVGKLILRLSEA